MCDKTKLNEILKQVRKEYEKVYGDKLVKVYLYGSYARGDFDNESDIDVAAIVKDDRPNLQESVKKIRNLASNLGLEYDIYISPKAIPYSDFVKYKDLLAYYKELEREGIEISA